MKVTHQSRKSSQGFGNCRNFEYLFYSKIKGMAEAANVRPAEKIKGMHVSCLNHYLLQRLPSLNKTNSILKTLLLIQPLYFLLYGYQETRVLQGGEISLKIMTIIHDIMKCITDITVVCMRRPYICSHSK